MKNAKSEILNLALDPNMLPFLNSNLTMVYQLMELFLRKDNQ